MFNTFYYVHVISAILLLVYLIFPFMAFFMHPEKSEGKAGVLRSLNRFGQYLLVISFLTGGYMISKADADLSALWMGSAVVLLLIMFAMAGMMSRPLKTIAGPSAAADKRQSSVKLRIFSVVNGIALILLMVIMNNQQWF